MCNNNIDLEDKRYFSKLGQKGIASLINAIKARNDVLPDLTVEHLIHVECRKNYINIKTLDLAQKHQASSSSGRIVITPKKKKLRQSMLVTLIMQPIVCTAQSKLLIGTKT